MLITVNSFYQVPIILRNALLVLHPSKLLLSNVCFFFVLNETLIMGSTARRLYLSDR